MTPTNLAFLRIAKRAERQDDEVLRKTFVEFGSVFTVVSSIDHQVIFGRRGTGKTHLLTVLRQAKRSGKEIAIQIDMRTIGSDGGLYTNQSIPLTERATRLLIDVLAAIHSNLFEQAVEHDDLVNLGVTGRPLDDFLDAHRSVKVIGATTVETAVSAENSSKAEAKLGINAGTKGPSLTGSVKAEDSEKASVAARKSVSGREVPRVNFGSVGNTLRKVVDTLPKAKLWILIDAT